MGGALHPGVDRAGASFELDRLELEDGLLVVSGSWFGLRGLRFVRPALVVDGRRVLARIEDKPWPVGEDGRWTAAFPWRGSDEVEASRATLVVAPSVEVALERDAQLASPPPGGGMPAALPAPAPRAMPEDAATASVPRGRERAIPEDAGTASVSRGRERAIPEDAGTASVLRGRERATAAGDRDEKWSPGGHTVADRSPAAEIARLERELDAAGAELAEAWTAADRHEARSRELEHVAGRERRAADEAETARDDLVRAHAIAVQDRDRAVARCEEAIVDREAAMRAHRRMQEQRDEAIEQRESAATRREEALAQRDEARMARDEVLLAHRALQRQLRGEWAQADRSRPASDGDGHAPRAAAAESDGERADGLGAEAASDPDWSSPLGVRVIPAARTVAAHLHRAQRVREHGVTAFDLWVMRILGTIAAVCFLTLLVMILKAFFAF
ncbi:MAG TPA: hypothetical protein VHZ31_04755 [Solirubrobacteraceae bacterium]|nr:hypothetical protein [Solirubrobacteraceae bacterium]